MVNAAQVILMLSVSTLGLAPIAMAQIPMPLVEPLTVDPLASGEFITPNPMSRVTQVSDLTDVKPSDWAYQTLKRLVDRYGILVGYPDRRFGGHRALNRYEFAAGLNSTLNHIDTTLKETVQQYATQEELAALKKLQADFAQELAVIRGKSRSLTAKHRLGGPFSQTTQLTGEVLFAITGVADGPKANGNGNDTDSNLALGSRVRLNFDTSFRGKDRLRTRLQGGNIRRVDRAAGTDMARLAYQGDNSNALEISRLEYRTPIGKQTTLFVTAIGGSLNDFTNTFNPFLSGSGAGAVSRFGQRNPIYRIGGGSGIGLEYQFTDHIALTVGYLGGAINDPAQGLGSSPYSAIAQLSIEFSNRVGLGLTYVRSFNSLNTGTGSRRANDPFADRSAAITADSLGLQAAIVPNKTFSISGWVGFTRAQATDLEGDPRANIFNWAVAVALPDLFKEGSVAGLILGQPPKLTRNDFLRAGQSFTDNDTSLHFEAFYRYPINDFVTITPGIIVITKPDHNQDNRPIYIGNIRTTFSF
jgi:Carbohydrate-selective porin, OprB family/S-layer homology domain